MTNRTWFYHGCGIQIRIINWGIYWGIGSGVFTEEGGEGRQLAQASL